MCNSEISGLRRLQYMVCYRAGDKTRGLELENKRER